MQLAARPGTAKVTVPRLEKTNLVRFGFRSSDLKLANPDVAEAHRITVILQGQRCFVGARFIGWPRLVRRWARQFDVILHQHAIEENRHSRGAKQLSLWIEARAVKNDIVGLPLARGTSRIDQRRILAVDGRGLAIRVGLVVIRIEHLNFVIAHQKDAAIAALLALASWRNRLGKLDVKLTIAEGFFRVDVAGLGNDLEIAVFDFPLRRTFILRGPLIEIPAIEEHDGVRWSLARRFLSACGAGSDDRGHRAV